MRLPEGLALHLSGPSLRSRKPSTLRSDRTGGRLGDRVRISSSHQSRVGLDGVNATTDRGYNQFFEPDDIVPPSLERAQALIFPSTVALVSTRIDRGHLGAGMGLIGMLRNAGKIIGPILGGVLVSLVRFFPNGSVYGNFRHFGGLYSAIGRKGKERPDRSAAHPMIF